MSREGTVVLGVDPGIADLGLGVVRERDRRYESVAYTSVRTGKDLPLPERLALLHQAVKRWLKAYRPDAIAMERLFFSKNVRTAMVVGQAQGVVLLATAGTGLSVTQYTPNEVKIAVTGDGKAGKPEVADMVRRLLGMGEIPKPDDAADALAIAYCHLVSTRQVRRDE